MRIAAGVFNQNKAMSVEPDSNIRRFIAIISLVVALILEPYCLMWFAVGNMPDYKLIFSFLGAMFPALLAGVVFLVTSRNRWRWLLLLLVLPSIFAFGYEIFSAVGLWYATHRPHR